MALGPVLLLGTPLTAAAQKDREKKEGKRMEKAEKRWDGNRDRVYERTRTERRVVRRGPGRVYPYSSLRVPPGHLPPPGECRVWLPGVPPGQQPSPQSCGSARYEAPPGAWIITHEGNRYRVNVYNRDRRNVIDEVRYYFDR